MTPEEADAANALLMRAYRVTFGSPDGQIVLRDLMKDCRFRAEVRDQIEEGKRRVFLRIMNFTQLDDEQVLALYAGFHVKTGEADA